MQNKHNLLLVAVALAVSCQNTYTCGNLVSYVDPRIDNGGDRHVLIDANVPFGMAQLDPISILQESDSTS